MSSDDIADWQQGGNFNWTRTGVLYQADSEGNRVNRDRRLRDNQPLINKSGTRCWTDKKQDSGGRRREPMGDLNHLEAQFFWVAFPVHQFHRAFVVPNTSLIATFLYTNQAWITTIFSPWPAILSFFLSFFFFSSFNLLLKKNLLLESLIDNFLCVSASHCAIRWSCVWGCF